MQVENGIAVSNNVIAEEDLPLPYVYYPGMYSAYFVFSENKNSQLYLCSCAMESIENHIKLNLRFKKNSYSDPRMFFVLNQNDFPLKFFQYVKENNFPNDERIINHLNFKNKLCHECNRKVPKYKYCHPMYGGSFKQQYGWYIIKQYYEFGIMPITFEYIAEICPQEILDLIKIDPHMLRRIRFHSLQGNTKEYERLLKDLINKSYGRNPNSEDNLGYLFSELDKQNRRINNIAENVVREKFGFKKVGEAWTSETILYYIVKTLFKGKKVLRHFRPHYLEGLELDLFIEELNLAIEYQGEQHFKPIKHWGGEISFKKLQERDKRKKQLCEMLGINLIYFNFDEELTDDYVKNKINSVLNCHE